MRRLTGMMSAFALVFGLASGLPAYGEEAAPAMPGAGASELSVSQQGAGPFEDEVGKGDGACDVSNGELLTQGDSSTPQDPAAPAAEEDADKAEPSEPSQPSGPGEAAAPDSEPAEPSESSEQADAATPESTPSDSSEMRFDANEFKDVPASHPFAADISWLSARGITTGWPDGTFRPENTFSRDALAAFLYRYAGSPEFTAPATSPFKDVKVSSPFYKEIAWAAQSGLTRGYSDGTFRPGEAVNRAAAAVFLWRLAGNPNPPASNPFVDVSVCNAQRSAILWLAGTGIAQGYSDHTFKPGIGLSRGAFAAFLHRYDSKGYGVKPSPASPAKDPAPPAAKQFRDVPASNPFRNDISWASAYGVANGYSDGTYRPGAAVTRDAFVAFLYRAAGSPAYTPPAKSPFKDVAVSHPFYREISWAAASGIAGGYADGTFRPLEQVSRAAVAAFLYRAAGNPSFAHTKGFNDIGCSEHRTAITWLGSMGIASGYAGGRYNPNAAVERQAVAAFLHRMCDKGINTVATPWARVAAKKDAIPASCYPKPAPVIPDPTAGIVDPQARAMTVKAQGYGSSTNWMIMVNQDTARVGIYQKAHGRWYLKYYWAAGPGAPRTPTVKGVFTIGNRGYSFGQGYTAYYWTQFYGDYLFHSVLYYQGTKIIKDGTLGRKVSHGCVRLAIENAKWINENIPRGTTVVSY